MSGHGEAFPVEPGNARRIVACRLRGSRTVVDGVDLHDDAAERQEHEVHAVGAVHRDQHRRIVHCHHLQHEAKLETAVWRGRTRGWLPN